MVCHTDIPAYNLHGFLSLRNPLTHHNKKPHSISIMLVGLFLVFLNSYVQFFYLFSNINLLISVFIVSACAESSSLVADVSSALAEFDCTTSDI